MLLLLLPLLHLFATCGAQSSQQLALVHLYAAYVESCPLVSTACALSNFCLLQNFWRRLDPQRELDAGPVLPVVWHHLRLDRERHKGVRSNISLVCIVSSIPALKYFLGGSAV